MSLASDIRTLRHLVSGAGRGSQPHGERMERFYREQAADYDRFRARLLPGRHELLEGLSVPPNANIVDMGGGTGANLEFFRAHDRVDRWTIVDLSPSLLDIARKRRDRLGFRHVELVNADVCAWSTPAPVDVVLFSYSLTMIPDWLGALDRAEQMLRPGGQIAIVDFTVSRKFPEMGLARHGAFTRSFWPLWFSWDNVFLNPDHLPYLRRRFRTVSLHEDRTRLPFLPGSRVPYFRFVGEKR